MSSRYCCARIGAEVDAHALLLGRSARPVSRCRQHPHTPPASRRSRSGCCRRAPPRRTLQHQHRGAPLARRQRRRQAGEPGTDHQHIGLRSLPTSFPPSSPRRGARARCGIIADVRRPQIASRRFSYAMLRRVPRPSATAFFRVTRNACRPAYRCVVAAPCVRRHQRHRRRAHSGGGAEDRDAVLGARHHQGARPRPQSRSADRDARARLDRGRQDRAQGRLGRPDAVGLAVGRARALARRQPGVLSVVEHARRRDGAGAIADQRDRRSQGPQARHRGRPARQELAAAAGAGAPLGHRSQAAGDASSTGRRRCCPKRRCRASTTRR